MRNPARVVFRVLLVVIIILAGLLLVGPSAKAQLTLRTFVDPHTVVTGGTIGFAFAGDKFVGSVQGDGADVLYQTDLSGNNVTLFAPSVSIPSGNYASEHPVAGSPGLGGFPLWDIYVGAGNSIIHFSHDGTKSDVFAKNLPSSVQSILFDNVGTFKFEMIVATFDGSICHINSTGVWDCPISSLGLVEGMDVAPLGGGFGTFDGQLIIVGEFSGLVQAISPSWHITVLNPQNPIQSPESLNFVPLNLGSSGTAVEGFYEANYPQNIVKADAGQFSNFKGDAIIANEHYIRTIWRMHWTGTSFVIETIGSTPIQGEDGIFVTPRMLSGSACTVPPIAQGRGLTGNDSRWCAPHCIKGPTTEAQ